MNHIEEMMKTAGVEIDCLDCQASNMIKPDCENCFTAEKQLDVIKLIGKVKDFNCFFDNRSGEWFFSAGLELPIIFDWQESNQDFTQALAQLTTELMKAGELDKGKVKEVLES